MASIFQGCRSTWSAQQTLDWATVRLRIASLCILSFLQWSCTPVLRVVVCWNSKAQPYQDPSRDWKLHSLCAKVKLSRCSSRRGTKRVQEHAPYCSKSRCPYPLRESLTSTNSSSLATDMLQAGLALSHEAHELTQRAPVSSLGPLFRGCAFRSRWDSSFWPTPR